MLFKNEANVADILLPQVPCSKGENQRLYIKRL